MGIDGQTRRAIDRLACWCVVMQLGRLRAIDEFGPIWTEWMALLSRMPPQ